MFILSHYFCQKLEQFDKKGRNYSKNFKAIYTVLQYHVLPSYHFLVPFIPKMYLVALLAAQTHL